MGVSDFNGLMKHVGHNILVTTYGKSPSEKDTVNVAIECETCNEVLLDFDREGDDEEEENLDENGQCKNEAFDFVRKDGTEVWKKCGTWVGGTKLFCESCQKKYEKKYPQGWTGYPGDTCEHGNYVGGCGYDFICPACESDY